MSEPTPAAPAAKPYCPIEFAKKKLAPYLVPYYLTLFAVLGALTTGFVVVIVLLMIVAANVNLLGWVE
jgi:hypothetical protein